MTLGRAESAKWGREPTMTRDDRSQCSWELSTLYLIDAACDRFEVAWRAGESPRIERLPGRLAAAGSQDPVLGIARCRVGTAP